MLPAKAADYFPNHIITFTFFDLVIQLSFLLHCKSLFLSIISWHYLICSNPHVKKMVFKHHTDINTVFVPHSFPCCRVSVPTPHLLQSLLLRATAALFGEGISWWEPFCSTTNLSHLSLPPTAVLPPESISPLCSAPLSCYHLSPRHCTCNHSHLTGSHLEPGQIHFLYHY